MSQHESSWQLLNRIQRGDEDAARIVFERYTSRLVALARSRLNEKLGQRLDADDIVQSAWGSFFKRASKGRYEVQGSGDLWCLLATITVNKLRRQYRDHSAEKRDMGREQEGADPDVHRDFEMDREPTSEEVAVILEQLSLTISSLEPVHQDAIRSLMSGRAAEDVSIEVGRSLRTVNRVMNAFQEALSQRLLSE